MVWVSGIGQQRFPVHAFTDLLLNDSEALEAWKITPSISAGPPHKLQSFGLLKTIGNQKDIFSDDVPVMKLTHRISTSSTDRSCETLLDRIITRYAFTMPVDRNFNTDAKQPKEHLPFASLSISTNNLEDHIRADALESLLRLNNVVPQIMFDCHKKLDTVEKSYSIFLSGCYYQDDDY